MNEDPLKLQRQHLSDLLEAVQRCAWFLAAAEEDVPWPLDASILAGRKKDKVLFDALSTINERFAKLQDTTGSAMRHATLLASEPVESFLKVLALYEKIGVLDSMEQWQRCTWREILPHMPTKPTTKPLLLTSTPSRNSARSSKGLPHGSCSGVKRHYRSSRRAKSLPMRFAPDA